MRTASNAEGWGAKRQLYDKPALAPEIAQARVLYSPSRSLQRLKQRSAQNASSDGGYLPSYTSSPYA